MQPGGHPLRPEVVAHHQRERILAAAQGLRRVAASMAGLVWQRRPTFAALKVQGLGEGELWRALLLEGALRFLHEGARLGSFTRQALGLMSAVSAGWPPTGNCTISIWESEQHMLRFAYCDLEGHGNTVRVAPQYWPSS